MSVPENETPPILSSTFNSITEFLASYGWHFLFLGIVINLIWINIKPKLQKWREKQEERRIEEQYRENPERLITIQEGMTASRLRFQEQHDQLAAAQAEKLKQIQEEKKKEKVKSWESIQKGASYKPELHNNNNTSTEVPTRPKSVDKKSRLPGDEYNPLMGTSSGACFRPSRRGGASGGG